MIAGICRAYPAYRPTDLLTLRADLAMDMMLGAREVDELTAAAAACAGGAAGIAGPDGLVRQRNADGSTSVSVAGGAVAPGESLVGQLGRLGSFFAATSGKGGE